MAHNQTAFFVALAATTLLTSAAWAESQQTPDQQSLTPQQISVEKDFGKVSTDGVRAFHEVTLTRLAIFDGRTDAAKKYVTEADTAFNLASADETVFTKAEADLKPPTSKATNAGKMTSGTTAADSKQAAQLKMPIAWLPVGGEIAINEDYTASPTKTTALGDANKSLKSGDRKGAIGKLRLADINFDVTLALVPLAQTIKNVRQATNLINEGKYYEASQVLRQVQDDERFDVSNVSDRPSTQ